MGGFRNVGVARGSRGGKRSKGWLGSKGIIRGTVNEVRRQKNTIKKYRGTLRGTLKGGQMFSPSRGSKENKEQTMPVSRNPLK